MIGQKSDAVQYSCMQLVIGKTLYHTLSIPLRYTNDQRPN